MGNMKLNVKMMFCSETGDTDTEEETRHCLCTIL